MNDSEKRLEVYRRLIDIARDIASTLDLDILLNRIVSAAADLTEANAASILLYDETVRQLHFQVATNLDLQTMRGLVVPLEGSIAGWVMLNREPVRISNAHAEFPLLSKYRTGHSFSNRIHARHAPGDQGQSGGESWRS